jgi:hypothetical protein
MKRIIFSVLLWCVAQAAVAEQWYHVEVIVFENLATVTDEQWPQMPKQTQAPLSPEMACNIIQPAETNSLLISAQKLSQSTNYNLLYHRAWLQPLLAKADAEAVSLRSDDGVLEGDIRLYRATYLHAALNLWLTDAEPQLFDTEVIPIDANSAKALPIEEQPVSQNAEPTAQPEAAAADVKQNTSAQDSIETELPRYPHLLQERRIKSEKLSYFDHPKLGAILLLTPVDTPEAAIEAIQQPETYSLSPESSPTESQ